MPYPDKPGQHASYTLLEQTLGNGVLPGQSLDGDFANLRTAVIRLNDFVRGVTRSDGALKNAIVTRMALAPDIFLGFNPPRVWEPDVEYGTSDTVVVSQVFYICKVAHRSSSVFANDLGAQRWTKLVDFGEQTAAAAASAVAAGASAASAAASASTASTAAGDAESAASAAEAARDEAEAVFVGWSLETFDGDGSETAFTLADAPSSAASVFATVDGDVAVPGVDFTLAGAVLTFATAPAIGAGNVVVRYGKVLYSGPPGPPGADGTDGVDGAGISIAGSVANYAALPGGLGGGDAGDAYFVTADGLLYIWDGAAFPASGSGIEFRGPAGADSYVPSEAAFNAAGDARYGRRAQNLADLANFATARSNLGVAQRQASRYDATANRGHIDGAFGLGASSPDSTVTTTEQMAAVTETGWHRVPLDASLAMGFPAPAAAWQVERRSYNSTYGALDAIAVSGTQPGRRVRRAQVNGEWGPWRSSDFFVTPEDFGARGDGDTDDLAALQACAASGLPVRGRPGAVYRVANETQTDGVYSEGVPQDWADMTIRATGKGCALHFAGGWENIRTVTAIATSVDTEDSTGFYTEITVSGSTAAYTHGTRIKIAADAPLPQMADYADLGEWAVVQGVYGGKIRIAGELKFSYAPGAYTVRVGILMRVPFRLRNIRVETPVGLGVSHTATALIAINRGYNSRLEGITIPHHYDRGIRIRNSYDTEVAGCDFASGGNHVYQAAEFSDTTRGYCVHSSCSWGTRIISNSCSSTRHFNTHTSDKSTPSGTLDGYGPDEDGICAFNVALNMTDSVYQTHHGAHNTLFLGNASTGCRGAAYTARGVGIAFQANTSFGDRDVLVVLKQHATSMTASVTWQGGVATNPRRNILRCSDNPVDVRVQGLLVEYRGGAAASLPGQNICDTTALFLSAGTERVHLADVRIHADATTFTALQAIFRDANGAGTPYIDDLSIDFSGTVVIPENVSFYYKSGAGTPSLRFNNPRTRIVNGGLLYFLRGPFADVSRFWGINSPGTTNWSDTKTIAQSHALLQFAGACRVAGIHIEPRPITSIADAPSYVGQPATSGGNLYMAKGTSSPADWVVV